MYQRVIYPMVLLLGALSLIAYPSPSFSDATLQNFGEISDVWWHGRTSFHGQVIAPTCTLATEDAYQTIDMGGTSIRELQKAPIGPEKKFRLRLRNCELAGRGKRLYTSSRIRVTFDGEQGGTPDTFLLAGQAKGIDLQIRDMQGDIAKIGKPMPPLLLSGNEEELNYTLRVIRNSQPLKAGNYYAVLRFKVDYE